MTTKTKHLLYRHIPSIIIVLLFIFVLIQSIFIDNFGNTYFSEIKTASNKEQIEAITHLKNQFIAGLQNQKYTSLMQIADNQVLDAQALPNLSMIFNNIFPKSQPLLIRLIGYQIQENIGNNSAIINASYLYKFPKNDYIISVHYKKTGSTLKMDGFHFDKLNIPLDEANNVSFKQLSNKRLIMLSVMFLFPLIILFGLIWCIHTDIKKRKWLWILFILFGFGTISFNWTTQAFAFQPISFALFGASWFRASCYAPLILSVAFPIGAIIFIIKRLIQIIKK